MVTGRARPIAPAAVPAGLTGVAGAISGGAEVAALAGTAPRSKRESEGRRENQPSVGFLNSSLASPGLAAAAVGPSLTCLTAHVVLVPRVAQAEPAAGLTAAVAEVAAAAVVTAGPPQARLALTHSGALVARRHGAVARKGTLEPPVASVALASASQLVAAQPHGAPADALTGLGAGGVPPALVAGAVSVHGVAAAAPGALAGVAAERTPAVGVAGALTGDRVAPPVWVAPTRLAAVWSPELRRTAWGAADGWMNAQKTARR